jgi:hydroxypyruvate isomerase
MDRRKFLAAGAVAGAAGLARATTVGGAMSRPGGPSASSSDAKPASRLKLSVSRWPYGKFTLDQLCQMCRELGMQGVDLLEPEDWTVPLRYGLVCAMGYATVPHPENRLIDGFNRVENHAWLIPAYQHAIPLAAAAKVPNVICFSGTRKGQSDEDGRQICARGLAPLIPLAEQHGVTLCMELLNSKVDHPDYQCDHTAWGVALAKTINSPRFKLLYDIYHMQIMEGDVIRTVTDNIKYIGHFHTGGVPGRHEIDDTQELNYHRVMQAIADAGFPMFVAQEFVPTKDPRTALAEAVAICTV